MVERKEASGSEPLCLVPQEEIRAEQVLNAAPCL